MKNQTTKDEIEENLCTLCGKSSNPTHFCKRMKTKTKPTIGTTTTENGQYRQTATQPAKPKIKGSKKWGTPMNQTTTEAEIKEKVIYRSINSVLRYYQVRNRDYLIDRIKASVDRELQALADLQDGKVK